MRYYYDDPIKALWMAREHDIKLCLPADAEFKTCHMIDFEYLTLELPAFTDEIEKYYIHSSSHALLEPKVGDQVYSPNLFKTYRVIDGICRYPHELSLEDAKQAHVRIIQRDEKAWFSPEREEEC